MAKSADVVGGYPRPVSTGKGQLHPILRGLGEALLGGVILGGADVAIHAIQQPNLIKTAITETTRDNTGAIFDPGTIRLPNGQLANTIFNPLPTETPSPTPTITATRSPAAIKTPEPTATLTAEKQLPSWWKEPKVDLIDQNKEQVILSPDGSRYMYEIIMTLLQTQRGIDRKQLEEEIVANNGKTKLAYARNENSLIGDGKINFIPPIVKIEEKDCNVSLPMIISSQKPKGMDWINTSSDPNQSLAFAFGVNPEDGSIGFYLSRDLFPSQTTAYMMMALNALANAHHVHDKELFQAHAPVQSHYLNEYFDVGFMSGYNPKEPNEITSQRGKESDRYVKFPINPEKYAQLTVDISGKITALNSNLFMIKNKPQ